MNILTVQNLTKKYGEFTAVDDISFSLKTGEILGILGANGAGKTTTIQMLLGILTPTHGSVHYFGKELEKNREEILEKVNFSSSYTNLPWILTIKESFIFISYLYQIKNRKERINEIIQIFNLENIIHKKFGDLSAGQMTKVNLAKSFINFPKILLLDEPTASLDPETAKHIRELLLKEREKFNVSIIITSHNMSEVEEICDRVIFINQGKIIDDDTPENLAKRIEISHVELLIKDGLKRLIDFCLESKISYKLEGRYIIVDIKEKEIPDFLKKVMDMGVYYNEISIEKPSLEDYFLEMSKPK